MNGRVGRWWARSGLAARIAVSAAGVAVALGVVFALLLLAIGELRGRSLESTRSQQVIATANSIQTLVIDLETGLRGFVITNEESYLKPWSDAQARYPAAIKRLLALTSDNPDQLARATSIKEGIDVYLSDYSLPLVKFMRRNPSTARQLVAAGVGRGQVVTIRDRFRKFVSTETALGAARDNRARATARNAIAIGGIGLGTALLLILAGAIYVERAVARPVRLAAEEAQRVAGGDFSGRLPTRGPGEVGQLERSFNTMAASLERTLADLEERNRTLVESEQVKSELVSNVSHELRTPLASVLGFSDLMLKRDLPPEEMRRYLEVIRTEAGRLASLLNDLLDLQKVEQDTLQLRIEDVELNALLSAQVTLYSAQSELHALHLRPADEPLVVRGDRDRLAQVIGNLLSNAIKYSPDGGDVYVTAALIRDEAWVWVRDQGLGIPAEHQEQIFTKFFRADTGRERGIAGTGLGLVLAQQIVEAHGGRIGFDSEEDRGSTFWLRLPAAAPESDLATAPGDRAEAGHGV